jgi:PPIC-type PPIASE domain
VSRHDRSRDDGAQRWASILIGAVVIGVVGWMTLEAQSGRPITKETDAAAPAASAAASAAPAAIVDAGVGPVIEADLDAGLFLPSLSLGDAGVMPSGAPRSVKLGVVLVAFAGAEGAPSNARSKKDALVIAERLGAEAKTDFHHAVTSGDSGSSDDIGRIPRGVLDPRTEISVFALAPGDVSDVLETPRGYWIVKRID